MAIAPTGIAFAIEIKTRSFERGHLAAVRAMAVWLYRRRRRWCRRGALPVLCVVRERAVERVDDGVLIVSVERLVGALRRRPGQRGVPGSSLRTSRAADGGRGVAFPAGPARDRELNRGAGLAGRGVWSGGWVLAGFVGEDADDQEVRDAVGDRLGHARGVAVERADGERREPAGLLGMLDERWCLARR